MEAIIINGFKANQIKFHREVSFDGLVNPSTGCLLRYDFYLPEHNLIVEYDGKSYHGSKKVKERDEIKNRFAELNGINLIRISGGEKYIKAFFKTENWHTQNIQPHKQSNQSYIAKKKKSEFNAQTILNKPDPIGYIKTRITELQKSTGTHQKRLRLYLRQCANILRKNKYRNVPKIL